MVPSTVLAVLLMTFILATPYLAIGPERVEAALVILSLATLLTVPTLIQYAGLAKRCRDIGYSGWLSLAYMIPIIGFFFLLWCGTTKGKAQANRK